MMPGWDTRILWLEQKRRWWWNAWHAATTTELYGFADSESGARRDLTAAIADAEQRPGALALLRRATEASGAA